MFDSLNYVPNLVLGMEAAGKAGKMSMHKSSFCLHSKLEALVCLRLNFLRNFYATVFQW